MDVSLDLDKALVSSLLKAGKPGLHVAREKGLRVELLEGAGKTAYEFVIEYVGQYDDIPSPQVVYGKIGVELEEVAEPVAFFVDEVLNRALHNDLRKRYQGVIEHIEKAKPHEALAEIETMLRAVRQTHSNIQTRVESIPRLFGEVVNYYDRIKSGARGILTPWATVNDETLGFWPEDLVLFAARLGIGKTWSAAILGQHAWAAGHRVLFATTEMSQARIAMRFAALHFKLSYSRLRKALLDVYEEQKFRDGVKDIMDSEGLYVIGGDFDFRPASYEAAIEECEPVLAIFDGAYLLKGDGHNRFEQAANAFNELKRICKRTGVPNVVTMQLNRDAKKGGGGGGNASGGGGAGAGVNADNIALTDVAGWNADLAFGLMQTEDMKRDRRMRMKPLKVREGEGEEFELNWNLESMDFTELPRAGKGDAAEDVFGTGVDPAATFEAPF